MRVLMIAPPGAGKGTQGALIAAHFGIPHIATGDLLRRHVDQKTPLGLTVAATLARGELVGDEIVLDMLRIAFTEVANSGGGYVLDGLPRTMTQAHAAYNIGRELGVTTDVALHLTVDDDEVTRRLLARAASQGRTDDTSDVIAHRLALYHEVTVPILDWYAQRGILITIDAFGPIPGITEQIISALTDINSALLAGRRPVGAFDAALASDPAAESSTWNQLLRA